MADKKISALPAATTPLAGSEVLPIVQGGTTDKVSVANLTAGRDVSVKDLNASGNLVSKGTAVFFGDGLDNSAYVYATGGPVHIYANAAATFDFTTAGNLKPLTAGKGIDFSANANAPGMTSELLTWYEEGAWTPTYYGASGSAGSLAYAEQSGKYTRIGRQVTVTGTIILSDKGSWTGRVQIGGFPFASSSDQFTGAVELRNCTFTGDYVIPEIGRAGNNFARFVIVSGSGANSVIDDTMVANNSGFLFTLTYFV